MGGSGARAGDRGAGGGRIGWPIRGQRLGRVGPSWLRFCHRLGGDRGISCSWVPVRGARCEQVRDCHDSAEPALRRSPVADCYLQHLRRELVQGRGLVHNRQVLHRATDNEPECQHPGNHVQERDSGERHVRRDDHGWKWELCIGDAHDQRRRHRLTYGDDRFVVGTPGASPAPAHDGAVPLVRSRSSRCCLPPMIRPRIPASSTGTSRVQRVATRCWARPRGIRRLFSRAPRNGGTGE